MPKKFLIILFLVVPCLSVAEISDKKIGRLEDGRPYRVDAEGHQLVDHIAELEVALDDFKRQVLVLEGELEEKEKIIKNMTSGEAVESAGMRETNLLSAPKAVLRPPLKTTSQTSLPNQAIHSKAQSCAPLVEPLDEKVTILKRRLKKTSSDLHTCQNDPEKMELRQQVSRLQGALMSGPSKEVLNDEKIRSQRMQEEVSRLNSKLSAQEEEFGRLSLELSSKQESLEKVSQELQQSLAQKQILRQQVAALSGEMKLLRQENTPRGEERARIRTNTHSSSPVVSGKKKQESVVSQGTVSGKRELQASLRRIQKLIGKRKSLLDHAKKSSVSVSVKPQHLVSRRGRSLDNLRAQAQAIKQEYQILPIRKDLHEIEDLLTEDIRLLKRLVNL